MTVRVPGCSSSSHESLTEPGPASESKSDSDRGSPAARPRESAGRCDRTGTGGGWSDSDDHDSTGKAGLELNFKLDLTRGRLQCRSESPMTRDSESMMMPGPPPHWQRLGRPGPSPFGFNLSLSCRAAGTVARRGAPAAAWPLNILPTLMIPASTRATLLLLQTKLPVVPPAPGRRPGRSRAPGPRLGGSDRR